MLKSAVECYGYQENDVLNDIISSFATFGGALGEIFGPLFVGIASDFLGVETSCAITALINFVFAFVFFFGTGYLEKVICCKKKNIKVGCTNIESLKFESEARKSDEVLVTEV